MSAAQSAHYLVDKDGKVHPADVWSLVESSNPTLIDRWEIPTRWRVQYRPCPTFEGMTYWAVLAPGAVMPVARFRTWREAMDWADRQARTVEVVLPRFTFDALDNWKTVPGTQNVFLGLYYREAPVIGEVEYELKVTDCETTYLNSRDARPLALALLALAEQEDLP